MSTQHSSHSNNPPRFEWQLEHRPRITQLQIHQQHQQYQEHQAQYQSCHVYQSQQQQSTDNSSRPLQSVAYDQMRQLQYAIIDQVKQVHEFYSLFAITFYRISCI